MPAVHTKTMKDINDHNNMSKTIPKSKKCAKTLSLENDQYFKNNLIQL